MPTITPGNEAPSLEVDTLSGESWNLSERSPENFTMIVFFRGLHCPVCKSYISELDGLIGDFAKRGTDVIAISGDTKQRAEQAKGEWELENVEIGFGLTPDEMTDWGLYVSSGLLDDEPDRFGEPGLFLADSDNTVYYAAISSMPFGRPPLEEMRDSLDFVIDKDFPARGIVEV